MTMNIIKMQLKGNTWRVALADNQEGPRQSYIMPRQGAETMATAAARLEDTIRELKEGTRKPLVAV
jgi:hypothetical protein